MTVAISGRVDENQKPFDAETFAIVAIFAILRANIDGRLLRHRSALEDSVELGRIIL